MGEVEGGGLRVDGMLDGVGGWMDRPDRRVRSELETRDS